MNYGTIRFQWLNISIIRNLGKSFPTVRDVKVMHMPPNPFNASAKKMRMDKSAGERGDHQHKPIQALC